MPAVVAVELFYGIGQRISAELQAARGPRHAAFQLLTLEPASPRIENNEPVRGLVVVAEKT